MTVRNKIALLAEKLRITSMDEESTRRALANPKITDIEDGMQY